MDSVGPDGGEVAVAEGVDRRALAEPGGSGRQAAAARRGQRRRLRVPGAGHADLADGDLVRAALGVVRGCRRARWLRAWSRTQPASRSRRQAAPRRAGPRGRRKGYRPPIAGAMRVTPAVSPASRTDVPDTRARVAFADRPSAPPRAEITSAPGLNACTPFRRETMSHRVTLIPGDGVGPEITAATRRVIEATGVVDRVGGGHRRRGRLPRRRHLRRAAGDGRLHRPHRRGAQGPPGARPSASARSRPT